MTHKAKLQAAIDRFAGAVEDYAFLGTIPVYSDDDEEQRAIDRERSRIVNEREQAETALKKLFGGLA